MSLTILVWFMRIAILYFTLHGVMCSIYNNWAGLAKILYIYSIGIEGGEEDIQVNNIGIIVGVILTLLFIGLVTCVTVLTCVRRRRKGE